MRWAIALLVLARCSQALGQSPPPAALPLLPVLAEEVAGQWPTAPGKAWMGAQVEQETCPSLTSKKCWNPCTELLTDREYGFGLGQLTVTSRFNAWEEVRAMSPDLRSWKWEDRYNPRLQLRALVAKNRYNYARLPDVPGRLQFTVCAYNGGLTGCLNDVKLCSATAGCDPRHWWGNVELTSLKSRTKAKGYGKSFYEVNREYVRNVLLVRRKRYTADLGE